MSMTPEDRKKYNRVRMKKWKDAHRELVNKRQREYRTKHAKESYERNRKWAAENPELVAEYYKRSNEKHPDSNNKGAAKWRKNNPEKKRILTRQRRAKIRAAQGRITKEEWESVLDKYGLACLCCKKIKPLTMDHIRAIDCGGTHTIDNVQPLCRECNSSKGTKEIDYRPVLKEHA